MNTKDYRLESGEWKEGQPLDAGSYDRQVRYFGGCKVHLWTPKGQNTIAAFRQMIYRLRTESKVK